MNWKTLLTIKRSLIFILLIVLAFLSIMPFWILLVNATRSTEQIKQGISLIPSQFMSYNWNVLTSRGFSIFQGFKNSAIIAGGASILSLYFSALTAYALVAYKFRLNKTVFFIVLGMLMVPPQISMIGFYQFVIKLNWLDSFLPLIVPAIAAPGTVFFFRQYLKGVFQPELVMAARIDGAGELRIFHEIMLPIMKPAVATMAIFTFVASWNNFMMPLILLQSQEKYTLPMLVQLLKTDIYRTEYGGIYLGVAVSIIPILVVYLLLSRYIIAGVALGGVKE